MRASALQLAPSGSNPTSFRLYEALQMGLVPVFLYEELLETPFLPYNDFEPIVVDKSALTSQMQREAIVADKKLEGAAAEALLLGPQVGTVGSVAGAAEPRLWHKVAVVLRERDLPDFYAALPALIANKTWWEGKTKMVAAARDSYFTYAAVMRHIYALLRDPASAELKCQQPPIHLTDVAKSMNQMQLAES
jgi:hypothetical protein